MPRSIHYLSNLTACIPMCSNKAVGPKKAVGYPSLQAQFCYQSCLRLHVLKSLSCLLKINVYICFVVVNVETAELCETLKKRGKFYIKSRNEWPRILICICLFRLLDFYQEKLSKFQTLLYCPKKRFVSVKIKSENCYKKPKS